MRLMKNSRTSSSLPKMQQFSCLFIKFLPTVRSAVYSHPEFQDVIVQAWTGAGGGLAVLGTVKTEQERTELQSVIAATKPPVSVSYAVKVTPIPEFLPNTALEPTATAP
jgi:hypothetical protein